MTEQKVREIPMDVVREMKIEYIIKIVKKSDDIRLGELYWYMRGLTGGVHK